MNRMPIILAALLILVAYQPQESAAQWSANPGETVRNTFGPSKNDKAPACRGACGMDCPSSCELEVQFECAGAGTLKRVKTYSCGTHQGCRDHDDCLDRCTQDHDAGFDCQTECNARAVEDYGVEMTGSWALGGGPYDDEPIIFEYSMDKPAGAEAVYSCPKGSRQQCTPGPDGCAADGESVDPVFSTFAGGSGEAVWVSGFRSGPVCLIDGQPSSVCESAVDIQMTGEDRCAQSAGNQACTWYGFEMDYRNANPAEPLICQSSGAEEDFLGSVLSKVIEAAPPSTDSDNEFGNILGQLQKELESGKSLDQVFAGISVTTADGKTMGTPTETFRQAGVPSEVALNGTSGHVLVPMFELHDASPPGTTLERQVRCLQQGQPVIETTFRLHFASN